MNTEAFERCYYANCKMIWNLCYTYLENPADTEDAVQETFLRLASSSKTFRDSDHEKAWLIVTARNVCKDELKRFSRKELPLEQAEGAGGKEPYIDETLEAVRALPERYQTVLYLYYYEGYPTKQIGRILKKPDATIRSDLHRGRLLMKDRLEGEK